MELPRIQSSTKQRNRNPNGARRGSVNVLRLVLRGAFLQVAIGLAIGIPATILAGRAMTTQLFGVKPYSPDILLVTTLVLSFAALVATVLPARKAASLEPIRALRTE